MGGVLLWCVFAHLIHKQLLPRERKSGGRAPRRAHVIDRWLRGPSDVFCSSLLDDLQNDVPLKVQLFYTRKSDASAISASDGDGSHVSSLSSRAGTERISRRSILEGVGEHLSAKLAGAIVLMSGPPGNRPECDFPYYFSLCVARFCGNCSGRTGRCRRF
jgi:hypothetical protein